MHLPSFKFNPADHLSKSKLNYFLGDAALVPTHILSFSQLQEGLRSAWEDVLPPAVSVASAQDSGLLCFPAESP